VADSNKTEKPTPRRRRKARDQGQVARTRELSGILALIAAVCVFGWQASNVALEWRGFLQSTFNVSVADSLTPASPVLFWIRWETIRWILPTLSAAWIVAVLVSVGQGGLVFAPEAMVPKPERMNPASKLQQMFSISSLSGLLKTLPPFICITYLTYGVFTRHWAEVVQASNLDLRSAVQLFLSLILEIGWKSLAVLVILATVDYLITWRKHEGDLKMSKEELREEHKETEGNPAIKARIRRLQRQVQRRQMLLDTEAATVVVTNPTHFAVALKYDPQMEAPIVVAKGRDQLAQEIKDVARWSNIPIMENPPLAQALFRFVAIGQQIPAKLYAAVAEILAAVFRAQARARQNVRSKTPAGQKTGPK
jgi:flagellar biosynthetic protein FlhB